MNAIEKSVREISYGKGAANIFTLQDCNFEGIVNITLRKFLEDWNIFQEKDRYPTSKDLMEYIRAVTIRTTKNSNTA